MKERRSNGNLFSPGIGALVAMIGAFVAVLSPLRAEQVNDDVVIDAFMQCFFPTGEERILKYAEDQIVIYVSAPSEIEEHFAKQIEYYNSFPKSKPAKLSNAGVNTIVLFAKNIYEDAFYYYSDLYDHMKLDHDIILGEVKKTIDRDGQSIEIFKIVNSKVQFVSIVAKLLEDPQANRNKIENLLVHILFSKSLALEEDDDLRCRRMFDPEDPIGRKMIELFNDPSLTSGLVAEQARPILKTILSR